MFKFDRKSSVCCTLSLEDDMICGSMATQLTTLFLAFHLLFSSQDHTVHLLAQAHSQTAALDGE